MKIVVFKNGNTREITGEEGKYWLTGEDRVRKMNPEIAEIRDIEVPEPIVIKLRTEPPAKLSGDVSTGKKPASRKKKKTVDTPYQSPSGDSFPQGKPNKDAEVKDDGDSGE